jgi:glycerol-3-phosphate dehydrogenase
MRRYDLIVIGGGALGTLAALEATRRGLATLLVERAEIGGGTSANTLRILHGGFRHLQRLNLAKMREAYREREWFRRWFPDLVEPLPCLMPFHHQGLRRPAPFAAALAAQRALLHFENGHAGNGSRAADPLPPGRILSAAEVTALFPAVRRERLQGGGLWYDATMPAPEELLREVMRWAVRGGAEVREQTAAEAVVLDAAGRVGGLRCRDLLSGEDVELLAPRVLNCAGPWARQLALAFDRDLPALFRPALAFNLELATPPPAPVALAVTAEGGTRSARFLLPYGERTLAGTWYAPVEQADAPACGPSARQIGAALAELSRTVRGLRCGPADVAAVRWGLLPAAADASARLRRHDLIHDHGRHGGPQGLLSLSTVKLTTARSLAGRALAALGVAAVSEDALPRPTPWTTAPDPTALLAPRSAAVDPAAFLSAP